jgi:hypothetical protein
VLPPSLLSRAEQGGLSTCQRFERRRSAFVITDAELRLMAKAAIIGDSSQPVIG